MESRSLTVRSVTDLNKLQSGVWTMLWQMNPLKKESCRRADSENLIAFKSWSCENICETKDLCGMKGLTFISSLMA